VFTKHLISKEISNAEHEYEPPSPPIIDLLRAQGSPSWNKKQILGVQGLAQESMVTKTRRAIAYTAKQITSEYLNNFVLN
jgi:hypothetical protein